MRIYALTASKRLMYTALVEKHRTGISSGLLVWPLQMETGLTNSMPVLEKGEDSVTGEAGSCPTAWCSMAAETRRLVTQLLQMVLMRRLAPTMW